jgi:drug/metabolite transporter (DMT)-like permease
MESRETAPGWLVWLALGIVYVVWGSTYLGIRLVVDTMPPLLTSGVRFMFAGAIMYAVIALRRGRRRERLKREEILPSILIGAALVAGGNGLVMVAEQDVPSGLAALIMASIPLWVVVFRSISTESVPRGTLVSVAVGFVGVAILVLPGNDRGGGTLGVLTVVAASFSWAMGTFWSGRARLPRDPLLASSVQMIGGGAVSLTAGLVAGEAGSVELADFSAKSYWALAYLVVFGSLIAYTAYVWVLQHAPVSKVATYAYVNPVVAIFLGWIAVNEDITPTILIASAIILSSVAATVRRESGGVTPEELRRTRGPASWSRLARRVRRSRSPA